MYYDKSPGGAPHTVMRQGLASRIGVDLTIATDLATFERELAHREWAEIVINARQQGAEPPYARSLRAFSMRYPETRIVMYLWHDKGKTFPPNVAVLGTTAIVYWQGGYTTIGYSLSPTGDKPYTRGGLFFPDFEGIAIRDPRVVATARYPDGASEDGMRDLVLDKLGGEPLFSKSP